MPHVEVQRILESSKLSISVPNGVIRDLAAFGDSFSATEANDISSAVEELPQRQTLYLDEIINVLIVLHTPKIHNDEFEVLKKQLAISLECFAVGARRSGLAEEKDAKAMTVKDLVYAWTNSHENDSSETNFYSSTDNNTEFDGTKYAAWKAEIHLSRSRIRSINSYLFLTATASILNSPTSNDRDDKDNYMASGASMSMNLLDGLQTDPAFQGNAPVLPASRLSKILPTGVESRDGPSSLRSSSSNPMRLVPAFRSRIRCPRVGAIPGHAKILACLDIDMVPNADYPIDLKRPQLSISDGGAVEPLTETMLQSFPFRCSSQDSVSFVYSLAPGRRPVAANINMAPYVLTVTLDATIPLSSTHHLPLKSSFRISVDLSSLHRGSVPKALPHPPDRSGPPASTDPSSAPTAPTSSSSLSHLLTVTITSPQQAPVGAPLTWSLLLANRSATRTLSLAIIPLTHTHAAPPPPPPPASTPHPRRQSLTLTSPASELYAHPADASSAAPAAAAHPQHAAVSLLTHTPDVRTGALPPGAAASAALRFTPLRPGALRVLALRIVDLNAPATAHVELAGALLPDIVAVAARPGEGGAGVRGDAAAAAA